LTTEEQAFIILSEQAFTHHLVLHRQITKTEKVIKMKTDRKHYYRISNPVRFFIFVVISIMIVIFAGYTLSGASNAEAAAVKTYAQVTIHEGDNLWNIVEQYNPDSNINVENAIYDIYEINDISADEIVPGQVIFVPIY